MVIRLGSDLSPGQAAELRKIFKKAAQEAAVRTRSAKTEIEVELRATTGKAAKRTTRAMKRTRKVAKKVAHTGSAKRATLAYEKREKDAMKQRKARTKRPQSLKVRGGY